MIMTILTFLIYLAIIWIVYWLACYIIDNIPVPSPPANWVKLVFMVIAVLFTLALLAQLVGVNLGLGNFSLR